MPNLNSLKWLTKAWMICLIAFVSSINSANAQSAVANLSAMTTTAGAISPGFSSTIYTYTVPVSVAYTFSTTTVTPTVLQANATIQIQINGGSFSAVTSGSPSSALSLNVGANTINVKVPAQNGTTIKTYTLTVTRTSPSTVATLSALTTTAGVISPVFASGTTSYSASVVNATTSVTVKPTKTNANSTIQVNVNGGAYLTVASGANSSALALNIGANPINIRVKAQDSITIITYTITVTRAGPSSNANLTALTTTAGSFSPVFASNTTSYSVNVASTITSVTVKPTKSNQFASIQVRLLPASYATVVSGANSIPQTLAFGNNAIEILVTAQDGSTKTYTMNVNRLSSGNANLTAFTTTAGVISPTFSALTTSYTASVLTTASVTVKPTKSDVNSYIEVRVNGGAYTQVASGTNSGALALNYGSNTINMQVTAQDSTKKVYTLTVTRNANANLSALTTTAGTISPVFSQTTTSYTASVSNSTSTVTVKPTKVDAGATIQARVNGGAYATVISATNSGALALNVGSNVIDVKVTGADGTTLKVYSINVTRVSINANLSALITSAGAISPTFSSGTFSYSVNLCSNSASTTITPTAEDATATIQYKINSGSYISISSGAVSSAIGLNVGTNTISVKVTAQNGTTINTYTIAVNYNPILVASVSIAAIPSGSICSGTNVTFTATPTNGGLSPTYQWKNNNSNILGATNVTYASSSLANNDVITCVMTSNASPCLTGSPATSANINMSVNLSNTGSSNQSSCDHFMWEGTNYTVSSSPTYTYTNAAGCDSVHTLNLTINLSSTGSSNQFACDEFTWEGTNYTSSGTPTHGYSNAAGCDSLHTLNLTIHNSSTSSSSVTACNSYFWFGLNNATGDYTHIYSNAAGCDSIYTLHLTI